MNSLNFKNGKWWEFSLNFKWPHEGFNIGFDLFQPTSLQPAYELYIYLGLVTFIFHWGNKNWIFEE